MLSLRSSRILWGFLGGLTPPARHFFLFVSIVFGGVTPWAAAQEARDDNARDVAAIQQRVVQAIAKSEKSVVAIARIGKGDNEAGFRIPSFGRSNLAARLDESFPTNPDFVPADFAAGVVIDRRGLIVTTYHVLGNITESDYFVWVGHKPFRAKVLAADGWFDLAVLKVDGADLHPIQFGDAQALKKGQIVIALGNPQAMARDGEASAAWGIVSNLLRRAPRVPERSLDPAGRETVHHYGTLIQTDIKLNSGYSGGALINLDGDLVGLTTVYSGGPMNEEPAGLALPVDEYFKQALEPLRAGKSPEFGFLGVGPQPLNLRLRQMGHHGVVVETVMPGTPAARGDIQVGDVITHVEGQPLYDDDDLFRIIGSLPPEHVAHLTVHRGDLERPGGEALQREIKLAKKQVNTVRPSFATISPAKWRGMRVDYATVAPREMLHSEHLPPEGCLYVEEVDQDSAAWKAGLRHGMFVTRVGTQSVTNPQEFFEAVKQSQDDVSLYVTTGNAPPKMQTVSP